MPKYNISITRTEYFVIEADSEDTAVDIAFDEAGSTEKTPYAYVVDGVDYGTVLEMDQTTDNHTVEEVAEVDHA